MVAGKHGAGNTENEKKLTPPRGADGALAGPD